MGRGSCLHGLAWITWSKYFLLENGYQPTGLIEQGFGWKSSARNDNCRPMADGPMLRSNTAIPGSVAKGEQVTFVSCTCGNSLWVTGGGWSLGSAIFSCCTRQSIALKIWSASLGLAMMRNTLTESSPSAAVTRTLFWLARSTIIPAHTLVLRTTRRLPVVRMTVQHKTYDKVPPWQLNPDLTDLERSNNVKQNLQ